MAASVMSTSEDMPDGVSNAATVMSTAVMAASVMRSNVVAVMNGRRVMGNNGHVMNDTWGGNSVARGRVHGGRCSIARRGHHRRSHHWLGWVAWRCLAIHRHLRRHLTWWHLIASGWDSIALGRKALLIGMHNYRILFNNYNLFPFLIY